VVSRSQYFAQEVLQLTRNLTAGLIPVVLGVVYLFMTLRLPDVSIGDPLGPRLFPMIVGIGSLVSGVLLVAGEIRAAKGGARQRADEETAVERSARKALYGKIGLTILAGVVYGFILDTVGYLISTFVFMMILMCLVNTIRRMVENTVVSIGFSVVTYVLFATIFQVRLPRGILAF